MGTVQKILIILAFLPLAHPAFTQGEAHGFREVDQESYALYQAGEWKELIRYNNQAIREGFDYYYLRMRSGIAWYQKKNYVHAARQFNEALSFNTADPVALEYLLGCYLELNKTADALQVYNHLPVPLKQRLQHLKPGNWRANLSAGYTFSDQPAVFEPYDIDGADDIYGETDLLLDGMYISAGISYLLRNKANIFTGYTFVRQDKNKMVKIADTLSVDDQYRLIQHQFYLGGAIPVIKDISIHPAVNYINTRFDMVMPEYNEGNFTYTFPVEEFRQHAFIGYLEVTRDFKILRASLFAAWSNLNETEQIQAGFHLVAYPLGNLNFYLSSKLLNHRNNGYNNIIFEQMAGARLARPVWAEAGFTVGEMKNYHESNGYVVYNLAEKMRFKGEGKLIWVIDPSWMITAGYIYMFRQGSYVTYEYKNIVADEDLIPVTMPLNFNTHLGFLALTYKF
ncbi:MAG: hypothetical protein R6W71_01415 [Bacteroidales bacterium]